MSNVFKYEGWTQSMRSICGPTPLIPTCDRHSILSLLCINLFKLFFPAISNKKGYQFLMVFHLPSAEKKPWKNLEKTFSFLDEVETCQNKKDELFYLGPPPSPLSLPATIALELPPSLSCVEGRGIALLSFQWEGLEQIATTARKTFCFSVYLHTFSITDIQITIMCTVPCTMQSTEHEKKTKTNWTQVFFLGCRVRPDVLKCYCEECHRRIRNLNCKEMFC